jgi:CRISPR-associated protein Cas1
MYSQRRRRFAVTWRSVVIGKPAKLRREHFSLAIDQEQTAFVPFEDIAVIVLAHREITITHPVLSACGEYGIGLYSSGDNHQPNAVLLPFLQHSRAVRMQRLQLCIEKPVAKRAWMEIVKVKIANQAFVLHAFGIDTSERLQGYAKRVRSGDSENIEAQAAAIYFPALFGRGFVRAQESWINAALDYGYAVMRGACARALVAYGMLPSIGLFHDSEQNAFNLADDLIEPYRPLVDFHVARTARENMGAELFDLTAKDKAALVALLNVDLAMPRGVMSALASIDQAAQSIQRLFDGGSERVLELPRVQGLVQHKDDR